MNLNVNTNAESDDANHYSEIDKISPCGSNWSTWPEDLRNSSTAQTYANVSDGGEPVSSFVAAPIPPPPPSIGPNTSPSKPKSNCELARSINELSLNSNSSANVTKKLDPAFLAELEKHLGEKEATKNTNSANGEESSQEREGANYLRSSQDKLQQGSTSTQQLSTTVEDAARSLSVIPVLKSPPHKKSKSPVTTTDRPASLSSAPSTSKVQNSWQSKSTNIQKPRPQDEQCSVPELTTDDILDKMWRKQIQADQQDQNMRLAKLTTACQTPVSQGSVNLLHQVIRNINTSANDHGQHGPCNVAKAISTQSQACSSNHSLNTTHINQLHETTSTIVGNTNEIQHGPSNLAKTTFNQAQACSANTESYPQNSLNLGQGVFNLLQVATNSVTNDPQYDVANASKTSLNQTQACSSIGSQNYNASSVALSLLQTASRASGSESSLYGSCNISKATSANQAQTCPMSQNYLQNQSGTALHQTYLQNVPMLSGASNIHKIAHIQNDLQHLKPVKLLSEQVYAELKQTVCNFHDYTYNKIEIKQYVKINK